MRHTAGGKIIHFDIRTRFFLHFISKNEITTDYQQFKNRQFIFDCANSGIHYTDVMLFSPKLCSCSFLLAMISTIQLMVAQTTAPEPDVNSNSPQQPITEKHELEDGVRVAILGYHDFSASGAETEMRINTGKFRKQMQALKDLGISVISMGQFLAWKRGEQSIPQRSAVITIDDGWLSVYTDAYPVLKEFSYPFTLFLYQKYINVQGKSLSFAMIKEMQQHGATLGSHSVTHPYPATVKAQKRRGAEAYTQYLNVEFGESKRFLEKNFDQTITTYAYPGGYHTDEMLPIAANLGYTAQFTVIPGKIHRNSSNATLPRYIILGNYDRIFDLAVDYRGTSPAAAALLAANATTQPTEHPVSPEAGAIINTRLPVITADLSQVSDIRPETLSMKIAGFGEVPAVYDPQKKSISWQVNRRLRSDACEVSVEWKKIDNKPHSPPLRWTFLIDKQAAYQPDAP